MEMMIKRKQSTTNLGIKSLDKNERWYTAIIMRQSKRTGGGGLGEKGVGGVREEREERGGGGSSKKSGKKGEAGKIAANYATMLKISQTTRAKSRLKGGSQWKSLGRWEFEVREWGGLDRLSAPHPAPPPPPPSQTIDCAQSLSSKHKM